MNFTRFGLLVRVNDLPQCRSFYRDMLHLGDPVTDSAFTVEFALSEQMILRLEQNHSPSLEHASSAAAWILECEDPQKLNLVIGISVNTESGGLLQNYSEFCSSSSVICCMAAWLLLLEHGFFSIHSEKLNFLLEKSIIYVILLIMFK